uniref:Putative conserved protein with signal anchor n=1 Tax=Ixodes ricinus TaxID=34613 RepID=A0A090XDL9_IXORI
MERCGSAIGGHPGKTGRKRKPPRRAQWRKWTGGLRRKCSDCCYLGNWNCWIARWERYRILSGLQLRKAGTRVSTFLHAMGGGVFKDASGRSSFISRIRTSRKSDSSRTTSKWT